MIRYSFIIPVKAINDYIHEAVPKILQIERDDYEIIIYPDRANDESWRKTRQIATGHCGPAEKRTRAIHDALGEILIFVDDDAYPEKDFLDHLEEDFRDLGITAVGGPAITPKHDSFWQKVSGAVFLSFLSGGSPERYVSVGKKRLVDDWPSVNLSIRKDAFIALNGFDCEFWPGEDTKLCLDIIKKIKGKILYDPALIVYHHRREGLWRHMKQVAGYGLHRGFFAKRYPATSLRWKYFLPTFFFLFVSFGTVAVLLDRDFLIWYLALWSLYFVGLLKSAVDIYRYEQNIAIISHALYYIFFTHLAYGFSFLRGFLWTWKLKSKLR
ncbi:MAG: glycosyltransferase [Candidatus Moranbacteria bacterium]|nr:glycosyltransferase [Candidatus Moranbacteria bacterium]